MKYLLISILFFGLSCVTSKTAQTKLTYQKPSSVLQGLDQNQYSVTVVEFENTSIQLYLKKDSVLDSKKVIKAVKKSWPVFSKILVLPALEIALVDSEGPIGGGPLATYIVTLYSTKKMSPLYKKLVAQATGWSEQDSTLDYIYKHYAKFEDPEQSYIDDIVIHELAHTIFGFGLTKATDNNQDWWFTFGLGLLYDRIVWDQIYDKESPLFSSAVKQWKEHYAGIKNLDQRLVRPELIQDDKYKLSRLQVYGHGKALVYLTELRQLLRADRFDKAVQATVQNHETLDYDQFISRYFLSDKSAISVLEKSFTVR